MAERPLPQHVLDAIERGQNQSRGPGRPGEALASHAGSTPAPGTTKRHKYGVAPKPERTARDGTVFASKREMLRYEELLRLKAEPEDGVVLFLRQVPIHLPAGKYVLDFLVFWRDGRVTWEDVKGHKTELYLFKKRQVEALYPFRITEL